MEWSPISETKVAEVPRTTLDLKAPARDQTANFWLKQLTATHTYLTTLFNELVEGIQISDWLTTGVLFQRMKTPSDQKICDTPITCLPTIYKAITSIICKGIRKYIDDKNPMSKEQKWCCRRSKDAKISSYYQKQ